MIGENEIGIEQIYNSRNDTANELMNSGNMASLGHVNSRDFTSQTQDAGLGMLQNQIPPSLLIKEYNYSSDIVAATP